MRLCTPSRAALRRPSESWSTAQPVSQAQALTTLDGADMLICPSLVVQQELLAIDYPHADIRKIMDVNVTGAFIMAQAAARAMMEHKLKSSIVMIASMSGSIANRSVRASRPGPLLCFPADDACLFTEASTVPPTTPAKRPSTRWRALSQQSGRVMAFASTPLVRDMWAQQCEIFTTQDPQGARLIDTRPRIDRTAQLLAAKPELTKQWTGDNPMGRIGEPWE